MDYILGVISELTSNPAAVRVLFSVFIGVAVIAFAFGAIFLLGSAFDRERERVVREVSASQEGGDASAPPPWWEPIMRRIATVAVPSGQKELGKTRRKLAYAGYRSANALGAFYSIKLVALVGLPSVVFLVAAQLGGLSNIQVVFAAWVAAAVGVIVPNRYLSHKVNARQKRLRDGFPDALDLLVVCSEAGLGLGSAIQRVASELVVSHPELADELSLVSTEMRLGVDRDESLRNLVTRNGLEDFRGFVATLSQAMRFGSSVSETLRIYSEEFRDKRMQRAEELAAKLPIKMIFPLALCMLPAFAIIALGPSILKVTKAFGGA